MQTSLARRQRRRRSAERRRPRGSGAARAAVIALPLLLFTTLLLLGRCRRHGVVAAYYVRREGSPGPEGRAGQARRSREQTTVYDRTGEVQLARLGDDRREVVTFEQIPPELVDATTAIEDKTFWENAGFDPAGFVSAAIDTLNGNDRGGSTITQQLVGSASCPTSAFAEGRPTSARSRRSSSRSA